MHGLEIELVKVPLLSGMTKLKAKLGRGSLCNVASSSNRKNVYVEEVSEAGRATWQCGRVDVGL